MTATVERSAVVEEQPSVEGRAGRLRAFARDPLVRNAYLLTLSSVLTGAVGVVFWAAAARLYSPAEVGLGTAAIGLMTFVASVAQLNLASALTRFVPVAGQDTARFVRRMYLFAGGAGLVCSAAATLVGRWAGSKEMLASGYSVAIFIAATTGYTLFTLQEAALTSLRRTWVVPLENLVFAVTKLGVLVVVAALVPASGILLSWAIAIWVVVLGTSAYLFLRVLPRLEPSPQAAGRMPPAGEIRRFIATEYVGAIASNASMTLIPVLIVHLLGAGQAALFSIAWTVAYAIHLFSRNMAVSLVVETADGSSGVRDAVRRATRHGALVLFPCVAVVAVAAPLILGVFGADYRAAAPILIALTAAALPGGLVEIALGAARARRRLTVILAVKLTQCVLVLTSVVVLVPVLGAGGAAVGWLATQTLLALALLVLRRRVLGGHAPAGGAPSDRESDGPSRPTGRVALAWRTATALGPRRTLRYARERARRAVRARGRRNGDPQCPGGSRIRTVSDATVDVRHDDGVVEKRSTTARGAHELRTHRYVVGRLRDEDALAALHPLLPRIVDFTADDASAGSVEEYIQGVDLAEELARFPARRGELLSAALAASAPLHRHGATERALGEPELADAVDHPFQQVEELAARIDPKAVPRLAAAREALRAALVGTVARVGWIHGDLTPHNIRVDGDRIAGIVDWGGARGGLPGAIDHYALLLTSVPDGGELGRIVVTRLRGGGLDDVEREALRAAGSAAPQRIAPSESALIALAWLHHVADGIRKRESGDHSMAWWVLNVRPVVDLLADRPALLGRPDDAAPAEERPCVAAAAPRDAPEPDRPVGAPTGTVDSQGFSASVVICAYTMDRWDDLVGATASVRAQDRSSQLVVVIDHSDELLDRARRELDADLVLPNRHRRGLSGARNTGYAAASGDVVAFLDDDAAAEPGWLAALCAPYADPAVLGVGGRIDAAWDTGRPTWFPREFDWVVGCSYTGMPTAESTVRNHIGASMSLRRSVLVRSGGFTEDLGRVGTVPLGCEETELCIRTRRLEPGGRHVYRPDSLVRHRVPASRATWSYFRRRCYAEGLSKAAMARITDRRDALASERSYTFRTLPLGVLRNLVAAVRHPGRARTAAAIVLGFLATLAGYAAGTFPAARRRRAARHGTYLVPLIGGVGLWGVSLSRIDLGALGDYGLIPLLPVTFWAALIAVLVGFAVVASRRGVRESTLACHAVALVVILHATPSIVYGTLRYSWAWKHVGVVDMFLRRSGVTEAPANLSIYEYWPGFFTHNATLVRAGGLHSPMSWAIWSPLIWNLLLIGSLAVLFSALTTDRRRKWAAVLLFVLGAWVGQDYFAPQAMAFFLYLTVIAFTVRYLGRTSPLRRGARIAVGYGALLPMLLAVAVTHQLMPLMFVCALLGLAVLFRYRILGPTLLAIVFTVVWDFTYAGDWLLPNLASISESIGSLGANADSGFVNLGRVSDSQAVIATLDRLHSAALWLLALAGLVRLWRRGRREWTVVFLALAPIPIVFGNDYGGEVVFRVYLFGLPFIALLAAAALFPGARGADVGADPDADDRGADTGDEGEDGRRAEGTRRGVRARLAPVACAAVLLALIPGFAAGYYGKENLNRFSRDEIAASDYLFSIAPRGSLIVSATSGYPWAHRHAEYYSYLRFALLDESDREQVAADPVGKISGILADDRYHHAYLIITRAQEEDVRTTGPLPPTTSIDEISQALVRSPLLRVVHRNHDAVVLTLSEKK